MSEEKLVWPGSALLGPVPPVLVSCGEGETANLTKVVDAAQEQVAAIEQLMRSQVWDTLPDKLRATAKLRCDNPEATLQELADLCQPPVAKTAINHRLRKLMKLADTM